MGKNTELRFVWKTAVVAWSEVSYQDSLCHDRGKNLERTEYKSEA
jgi:hypothetical protein